MKSSCVKSEIKTFNRNPKKIVQVYQHSSVLELDNNRKPFTNRSLHLNCQGKDVLSKLIVSSVLEKKIDPKNFNCSSTKPRKSCKRTSARPRSTPSMKSDFFEW